MQKEGKQRERNKSKKKEEKILSKELDELGEQNRERVYYYYYHHHYFPIEQEKI